MITENNEKYLSPPTITLIEEVVNNFGVTEAQFERFFGISKGTIKYIRMGLRNMPSKFWHLFYDPQYDKTLRVDRKIQSGAKPGANMVSKGEPSVKPNKSKNEGVSHPKLKKLLSK